MEANQFVVFKIEDREFAVDINRVNTIEKVSSITRVPGAQYFVMGVINLRGEVIPIVDTRKRLGMGPRPFDSESRIIILNMTDYIVGITADSATEVVMVNSDMIDKSLDFTGGKDDGYIEGIARIDDRVIVILDLERLLNNA
jgi:purine-binding chemotaxis protein CheW